METYERIKELRKKHLKLSQEEFGNKLGVSRDVIANIELNRLAKPEQKSSLIKLMCSVFSVNENWLISGNGDVFNTQQNSAIEAFLESKKADPLEMEIWESYFKIDPALRHKALEFFKEFMGYREKAEQTELQDNPPTADNISGLKNRTIESTQNMEEEYKKRA